MRAASIWRGIAVVLGVSSIVSTAAAHGRPAALGSLRARPGDSTRWVAQATWGMAVSDDGGASFHWLCAAAMGVDARMEDPEITIMDDGSLLAATFGGLLRSPDGGCTWERPESRLDDVFAVDVWRVDATRALAVASAPEGYDSLWGSDDGGVSWSLLVPTFDEVLLDRVRSAPSNPSRIYASGAIPIRNAGDVRRAFVLRSDDGGLTFERFELPLEDGERVVHVWAVDPRDPDLLYAQVLHFNGEAAPERIVRSEDGGATWATVHRLPYVGGLLVREDGSVYVGSRLGGLFSSTDGQTFESLDPALKVTCLSEIDGSLVACVDPSDDGVILARSEDGLTFSPLTTLSSIDTLASCPACTTSGVVCPAWEPDVIYDLGLDASLPATFDPDGGTGAPRDSGLPEVCRPGYVPPSGCGCRAAQSRGARGRGLVGFLALLVCLVCLRRRRTAAALG